MWYVEKYHPDGKHPYLKAHLEDFAGLRKLVTNRRPDKTEIVAPRGIRGDGRRLRSACRRPESRPIVTIS